MGALTTKEFIKKAKEVHGDKYDYSKVEYVKTWCIGHNVGNIGMPKNLGCGLAGGDWNGVVYPMIQKIFGEDEKITLFIYNFSPK